MTHEPVMRAEDFSHCDPEGRENLAGGAGKPALRVTGTTGFDLAQVKAPRQGREKRRYRLRPAFQSLAVIAFVLLSSCESFKVDLSSPEPIKVDVNMRLNVYQYKGDEPGKKDEAETTYEEAVERQRNRMAEIQKLKDNRFVGEDHRGLLHLREKPAGDWGDYVERTVNQENEDRTLLMRREAKDSNRALHEVQDEQWKRRTSAAYAGEWVELPGDKPNTYKWVQSTGPRPKSALDKPVEAKPAEPKPDAAKTEAPKPQS